MNKNGLYFLLGSIVGAAVSYFITKKYYDKKVTDEVIKVRKEYEGQPESVDWPENQKPQKEVKDEKPVIDYERDMTSGEIDMMKQFSQEQAKRQRTNYGGLVQDPDDTVAAMYAAKDLAEEAAAEQEHPKDSDEDEPIRIISEREYHETHMTDYGKIELAFYEEDNALCDDDEELISDPSRFIGEFALNSFGYDGDDPDVVYVRNSKMGNDYCITRLHASYAEMVLGIIPDDVDRSKFESRRRMKDE